MSDWKRSNVLTEYNVLVSPLVTYLRNVKEVRRIMRDSPVDGQLVQYSLKSLGKINQLTYRPLFAHSHRWIAMLRTMVLSRPVNSQPRHGKAHP